MFSKNLLHHCILFRWFLVLHCILQCVFPYFCPCLFHCPPRIHHILKCLALRKNFFHFVNLTILHDEDIEIRQKYGITAERRNKELRLCDEAIDQGGVLTQEDLAALLSTSLSAIKRDDTYL
ncbi:MAG: DUF1670 domain-containing protein, partial [Methanophagales archaeon]|nr:DUF1670 domain-containing protein [Methanophagales archaeon]